MQSASQALDSLQMRYPVSSGEFLRGERMGLDLNDLLRKKEIDPEQVLVFRDHLSNPNSTRFFRGWPRRSQTCSMLTSKLRKRS